MNLLSEYKEEELNEMLSSMMIAWMVGRGKEEAAAESKQEDPQVLPVKKDVFSAVSTL